MVPFASEFLPMASVIPNMFVALTFQVNLFPVFKGMTKSSDSKMKKVSLVAICTCVIFYIIIGNIGYCIYGNKVKGNFLLTFNRGDIN